MVKGQAPWARTVYDHVWQRGSRFKVTNPHGEYECTFGSIAECKAYFEGKAWPWAKDRTKRQSMSECAEKFSEYLKWRKSCHWSPADMVVHLEKRRTHPELVVAAPCTYALGIEGKEGVFWDALLAEYKVLGPAQKMKLMMLVSDVPAEYELASQIQYKIHIGAIRRCAGTRQRQARRWWSNEVQHNVSQHMGWLSKALALKVLAKREQGALKLGEMNNKYAICPWSPHIAGKYKEKATLVSHLRLQPVPRSFLDYRSNRAALMQLEECYHDLWFVRAFFEAERAILGIAGSMKVGKDITVADFVRVFPDSIGYVSALGKHFGTDRMHVILRRTRYEQLGFSSAEFTMDLCFAGQLHKLKMADIKLVKKHHFTKAMKARAKGKYQGHPEHIFRDAIALLT